MRALVSIHDLMPETMPQVEEILEWLKDRQVPPVTLLVVPGKSWKPNEINRLRELAERGHELAAHGWHHHVIPRKLYHRLHAACLSRNVAEHLDLDSKGILDLLLRSRNWFGENNLPIPEFYVPPAWALGPIHPDDLAQAPFKRIEVTGGLIHLNGQKRFQKMLLTGYEADTWLRESLLRRWNASQAKKAQQNGKILRISIHPYDRQLRVADQLAQQIDAAEEYLCYSSCTYS
ncbi:MAG: polysaccharide deacetylase family protein [Verrucomicrobiota bacterium]